MIRRTEIEGVEKYLNKDARKQYEDHSDFYTRWYEKFGKLET